ncbi:TRAP transporter substrate-binding protein [Rhodobium gokarnense]|uniref:Tripartite ATP-independent transporter DctP family solute receptor n=1 Tax=Rhodobium gokarnense TaxID=364296 RepID=A0ABT3H676_9HYPH|nr:TRAP transporter substrate-binding protein [Rhodobium gokarnense]MCW2305898.1 tripartite ATP-independent transporter DctP family solute receptor [Rhodobium gokarnense]
MNSMIRTAAAAVLLVSTGMAAQAADVTMNVGWSTPAESSYSILANKFEELVEKYSDGTIDVKLHCCGQIASEDDAFRAMQLGTVDAYFVSQNNISPHWPLMDVFVLPYMFQDTKHLVKVADGPIGDRIREQLRKDTGVHLLTFGGPSYRDFFDSVRPINTIEDMEGLKIRVPKNEVMLATFEAFGAEPVPLAWSETPTALQTGTIDGGDNGTSVIKEMKFYEFAKHLVILDHFASFSPLLASDRFMGKLDDAQREAVLRAAKEAGDYHSEITLKQTEEVRNWLATEGGMEITRPERGPFIKAAQKVQQAFAAKRGAAFTDLVNAIQAAAE